MFSMKDIPTSPSALFGAYASFSATLMLIRSMANDVVPHELRSYISQAFLSLLAPLYSSSSELTLLVHENTGMSRNQVFDAAEIYLRTKISPSADRLLVSKTPRQNSLTVSIDKGEEISDVFQSIGIKWRLVCTEDDKKNSSYRETTRFFEITFKKKFRGVVVDTYLPYVLVRANAIREEQKVVKLFSRDCPSSSEDDGGDGTWGSVNLEHPSTFETLAMDPQLKNEIVQDLERFVRRREFYKRVGKAWKRGYLLFGPPGTGKTSLIAAMANFLKFDIYDLELTSVYSNSDLRRVLLSTTNRSILVIEDVDCSVELQNRQNDHDFDAFNQRVSVTVNPPLTSFFL